MADALCGPSNPLQNFQKHSQVDRTLQQDRLVSRQGSSHGFRSGPGPTAGLLDPEFEAFQAGQHHTSPPPQFETHPLHARFPQPAPQSHFQQPPALPDWARDFQQLHIAPVQPAPSHQVPATRQAPVHSPTTSWHQDFMQSQPQSHFQPQQPMFQQYTNHSWQPQGQMQPQFSSIAQGKQRESLQEDVQFDAAAFEAAFDAAQEEALAAEGAIASEIEAERIEIDRLVNEKARELDANRHARAETNHLSAMDLSSALSTEEQAILDPQTQWPDSLSVLTEGEILQQGPIHDPVEAQEQHQEPREKGLDDEELSRTAGQLLESISHDTSQKFQDSVFLNLMRRIRDKEVRVEGENFVETNGALASDTTPAQIIESPVERIIPDHENDLDNGRFGGPPAGEPDASSYVPSRPLTPEIDPPGPTLATWRERLGVPAWPFSP